VGQGWQGVDITSVFSEHKFGALKNPGPTKVWAPQHRSNAPVQNVGQDLAAGQDAVERRAGPWQPKDSMDWWENLTRMKP